MTKRMGDDELMEARDRARCKADDKAYDRMERRFRALDPLVGELCREGRTIFYINVRTLAGRLTGAIREFATHGQAITFLDRNDYLARV